MPKGKRVLFDWSLIRSGYINWLSGGGNQTGSGRLFSAKPEEVISPPEYKFVPHGIRIRAQKAVKIGPILHKEKPWESGGLSVRNVLFEDGKYRMWYHCYDRSLLAETPMKSPNDFSYVAYAESDDGLEWHKPELGLLELEGKRTNVVFGGSLCPETGLHGWSVFRDPSSEPAERYKMIFMGSVATEEISTHRSHYPQDAEMMELFCTEAAKCPGERWAAIRYAHSPDGHHWTLGPEMLMYHFSDTQTTSFYDEQLKRYVGFFRMNFAGRRHIGRSETRDFRHWPLPEPVLTANFATAPYLDYYTNAKTVLPGSPDVHLMFPMIYDHYTDFSDIHLAASYDTYSWGFVPGGSVIERGEPGAWDGGFLAATPHLVPFKDDSLALPFHGSPMPHKYARYKSFGGGSGFAVWPKERIVALEAEEEGEFWLNPLMPAGSQLALNVRTTKSGCVRVAVLDNTGQPLSGRSLADADPIEGDFQRKVATWKGQDHVACQDGQPIMLHFQMRSAQLFSFEFA
jgi:hypothetical protein